VRIDLEEALSEDSVRAVQKGLAELAVIGDNVPCEGLESLLCNVDELVLLVPADHALATEKRVPMARALEHDLVTLPRHASLTRKIIAAADAAGTSARVRVQVRSFDAMCRMVACGLGLAVLPKAAAGLYSRALGIQIVALEGLQVARNLLLVMRRRGDLSAAAAALVSLIESDLASR
jgi:DNA-binding transcriptional LysR family regulator